MKTIFNYTFIVGKTMIEIEANCKKEAWQKLIDEAIDFVEDSFNVKLHSMNEIGNDNEEDVVYFK